MRPPGSAAYEVYASRSDYERDRWGTGSGFRTRAMLSFPPQGRQTPLQSQFAEPCLHACRADQALIDAIVTTPSIPEPVQEPLLHVPLSHAQDHSPKSLGLPIAERRQTTLVMGNPLQAPPAFLGLVGEEFVR